MQPAVLRNMKLALKARVSVFGSPMHHGALDSRRLRRQQVVEDGNHRLSPKQNVAEHDVVAGREERRCERGNEVFFGTL
jgi:hypothetical protein